ncbi:MAG: CgeB family protein [Desulfovibrio sp.]
MHNLRILVVLPMYGGSLPVGQFCSQALTQNGHIVEEFNAPAFYPAFESLKDLRVTTDRLQYLENSYLNVVGQAVMAKVETFQPDLVLAMAQAPLPPQILKRLRRDNITTAMWFVEDYRLFTYWKAYAPLYDIFAVIQKDPFFERLHAVGQSNVVYLPMAAHPPFHKPVELNSLDEKKYGSNFSFMGAGYPNRRLAFRQLANSGFKIWGSEWDGDHVLEKYVQLGGRRVSSEECVNIFNATQININLHSSIQADELVSYGDFVNPRTFEVAACGGFQLVDKRSLMSELFEDDELATFSDMDELKEKISYYLEHEDERKHIAAKGQLRVIKDHTYSKRMEKLINFTAGRIHDWPKPRKTTTALSILPQDLQQQVSMLLDKLGLSIDVSFPDLIHAIRQQQGTLSELDTALLFLDEWQKLYGEKENS